MLHSSIDVTHQINLRYSQAIQTTGLSCVITYMLHVGFFYRDVRPRESEHIIQDMMNKEIEIKDCYAQFKGSQVPILLSYKVCELVAY